MTQSRTPATWTGGEMLVTAAARLIRSDDLVLVGIGLPQMAALVAQRTRVPEVRLLLEIGVFEPRVRGATMGIADPRMWEGASSYCDLLGVLGQMLHRGRITLGLLGALQLDAQGSINSTLVRDPAGTRRFLGSGGANDVASLALRTAVLLRHQPRRFRATLDFLTSPGHRVRGRSRAEIGLPGLGTVHIVTDRCLIEITDQGAVLSAVHPGQEVEAVMAETPLALQVPAGGPAVTEPPSAEELRIVRKLDPHGWYTR